MPEPKFEDGPVLAPAPPKKVKKLKKYFKLSKLKSKLFFKYCSFFASDNQKAGYPDVVTKHLNWAKPFDCWYRN